MRCHEDRPFRRPSPLILGLLGLLGVLAGCGAPAADLPELAPELGIDIDSMSRTRSGAYYRDLRRGSGEEAVPGSVVVVHYTGWLADGTQFDSSRERGEPLVVEIGIRSRLVRGWNEGIQGMRVGGRRQLVVPPHLGYGAAGADDAIPPDATLVFDIELLEVR